MTATILSQLKPGLRLYDRSLKRERLLRGVDPRGSIIFLEFHNPATGGSERLPFPAGEIEARFELVDESAFAFRAEPEIVRLLAEAHRIQHAYLFNSLFTTETSLIDLLPHQLAAVYGVPAFGGELARPGMLDMPRLRFLLADDAGAGKTIMAGLLIREMLLRRLATRILVVSPAGLVGNWRRELDVLFRLRFRVLSGADFGEDDNPFADGRNDLAIISLDTLWRERARQAYLAAAPYDLVIFDEAHKLAASYAGDRTLERTNRYDMAERIALQGRHLLLLTATPHMGKDDPYYLLWRLLEPDLLSTKAAFDQLPTSRRRHYLLRRMKEEMVRFEGTPIFPPRTSETVDYPLRPGTEQEQDLYNQVTTYCELHFDRAKENNRSAAGLAMSILQRRLASSTWAVLKSLERREAKLTALIDQVAADSSGVVDPSGATILNRSQSGLPDESVLDRKTGDEEETRDGREESELEDEELAGATDARTLNELIAERDEVQTLVKLARRVYDRKSESKFERLWQALDAFPDAKVLIFTEFRDTLDFLRDRLQGKGLTGQIAEIHGGMDYRKRDEQAAFFEQGARIMVATDAAGEGINLQFCWLLVNYDIPWNPARLEQRMGRVHRYKQTHDVLLLNMVSVDTREGRVLKVLLDKLQAIRKELGRDKVFDIIGRQLTNKPLADIIFEATIEGKEAEAQAELAELDVTRARAVLEAQERQVETTEVRRLLDALRRQKETAEEKRMMPAYIRRFFQLAAPRVGVTVRGDIDGVFAFAEPPPALARELGRYPEALQERLTFDRDQATPGLGRDPRAIYLHPGEPVFEAVVTRFFDAFEQEAERGAVFYDPEATEPSVFYLARTLIVRDPAAGDAVEPETVEEAIVGLRRTADGRLTDAPPHLLLTLWPAAPDRLLPELGAAEGAAFNDVASVEAGLLERVAASTLARLRAAESERVQERVDQLRRAFNLRRSELLSQRRALKDAVDKGVPAAATKLRQCEADLTALDGRAQMAEADVRSAPDRLRLGLPRILVRALVLPLPPAEAEARRLVDAEKLALDEVMRRETAEGALVIEDVSDPHRKSGFDLKVTRADGSLRYIEVKGRRGRTAVELTENEWRQAANHPDRYWLYVVYDCEAVPVLYRVPDPFARLLGRQTGAVRINAGDILTAAEEIRN